MSSKWRCGNHLPVHQVESQLDKNIHTIALGCRRWVKLKPDLPPNLLPTKWRCGHKNPTHIAHSDDEKIALTRQNNCKNWRVG